MALDLNRHRRDELKKDDTTAKRTFVLLMNTHDAVRQGPDQERSTVDCGK